ncbi:hypothetical protein DSCW_59610 [Desulfosarcina widdelii]|uniref:Outer membrane protein beta-barrel domain-containing protein n=1 Tax=Desulfosarcina widdelii TaxID=947919 RepID=A0A5K7ZJV7_9BACT|nr:hypothetical protein [Desulfosarcina widdelii]BBO78544.1 hypothetical protein DSCW_59610 [Desulfosarcina widdelii]
MHRFTRRFIPFIMFAVSFLAPFVCIAEEPALDEQPWEEFGVNVGVFLSAVDSTLRFGSGISVDLDVEDFLGLDTSNFVFRADALWRFSDNRRHRLDFSWFSLNRSGERQILEDITVELYGKEVVIPAGTDVESFLDIDIWELSYSYSFFQDERIDLAAGIGLYIMPIDFGLNATGLIDEEGQESFTAPLPVVGLRMDIALTPRWFLRTSTQAFYLEYEDFSGSILRVDAAVEYNPWKHVGIGLGFDTLHIDVQAEGEDWPGVDLNGKVNFNYAGLQLYLRLFY